VEALISVKSIRCGYLHMILVRCSQERPILIGKMWLLGLRLQVLDVTELFSRAPNGEFFFLASLSSNTTVFLTMLFAVIFTFV